MLCALPRSHKRPCQFSRHSPWDVLHNAFNGVWWGLLSLSPAPGLTAVRSVPLPLLVEVQMLRMNLASRKGTGGLGGRMGSSLGIRTEARVPVLS